MAKGPRTKPTAVTNTLLPTDSVLVWQLSTTPHTGQATMTQVLQAMAPFPATFASVKVAGVSIVPGPTLAQFSTLDKSATSNRVNLASLQLKATALEARLTALETGLTALEKASAISIKINSIPDQRAGASFTVSGSVTTTPTVPTLQYQQSGGTWTALPGGLKVVGK